LANHGPQTRTAIINRESCCCFINLVALFLHFWAAACIII